jgi:hypothetical protein
MPAQRFARVFCNANWLPQANSAPPKITADGLLESSYRRLSNLLVGSSLQSCFIDKYRQIGETRSVGVTGSGSDLQNKNTSNTTRAACSSRPTAVPQFSLLIWFRVFGVGASLLPKSLDWRRSAYNHVGVGPNLLRLLQVGASSFSQQMRRCPEC